MAKWEWFDDGSSFKIKKSITISEEEQVGTGSISMMKIMSSALCAEKKQKIYLDETNGKNMTTNDRHCNERQRSWIHPELEIIRR